MAERGIAGRASSKPEAYELRLDGVSFSYSNGRSGPHHQPRALSDFSLTVEPGEFLTLLGPSGSGKTTALRLVAGHLFPGAGRIVLGDDITIVPPRKRDIGMVFQNFALFPHKTVEGNVAFGLQMRKWSKPAIRASVRRMLDVVQLTGFESRRAGELSGGQQQRVALARALAIEPRLLLFDEPLSSLDAQLRQSMQLEIRRIQQEAGITTLYVTHDQEEALTMSDRVAVMNEGRVEQVEGPKEVYHEPRTWFVANFVGELNTFSGTVVDCFEDGYAVDVGSGMQVLVESPVRPLGLAQGDGMAVGVRPENMVMHEGLSPEPPGGWPGVVRGVVFRGLKQIAIVELYRGVTVDCEDVRRRAEVGQQVTVRVDGSQCLGFVPDAGL
nr:ABC transporter ATP-binding protein [Egibacter rhizosphaerae]